MSSYLVAGLARTELHDGLPLLLREVLVGALRARAQLAVRDAEDADGEDDVHKEQALRDHANYDHCTRRPNDPVAGKCQVSGIKTPWDACHASSLPGPFKLPS